MKKYFIAVVVLGSMTVGIGNIIAKDFEQRRSLDVKSRITGLGKNSIELLERLPGPGRALVAEQISERFSKSRNAMLNSLNSEIEHDHNNVKIMGDSWIIKTWGSGSKFMYFDEAYTRRPEYRLIPINERFTNEELERMGRNFIKQELDGLVKLGKGEKLVPLKTEFEIEGAVNKYSEETEERIVSSIVVFGRKVDGVDIVGPGSTVAIFFANDGVPFAFDVDWPEYKRTKLEQDTIPVNEIFERLSTYGVMKKETEQIDLRSFNCGYFDAGEQHYDPYSYIQAGCAAQTIGIRTGVDGAGFISPILNYVPAGADVVWDDNWRESKLIGAHGDQCMETDLSDCIPEEPQAEQGAMEDETNQNLFGDGSITE
ncbi:MAG: hypothetical protein QNJ97_28860 [Myxococcota bacterium]|nr:hypothetical protein [Myxococcota bacterium]